MHTRFIKVISRYVHLPFLLFDCVVMHFICVKANIVPLTNTKSVLATLVHLAHNPNSSFEVRRMACNTLSNISLWLQTLAGKGTVPEEVDKVLLPSNVASGWQRWE